MACRITSSCSASSFSVCAKFIFNNAYSSSILRASSTRFIFKTKISLVKVLIPPFTRSAYNVLPMCSTNYFSGFSSIFLQMKREVDKKSNMLFCYCYCEYDWFLRLCASNAKPHGILKGQRFKTAKGQENI